MNRLLTVVAVLLAAAPGLAQEPDEKLQALTQRVEAMEKLLIKDPLHPDRPALARLEAVEKKTADLVKDDALDAKAGAAAARADDAVQKALKDAQRSIDQLDRRLQAAEKDKPNPADAEVKELRRDLRSLQTALEGLKDRVARLEAKAR